MLRFMDFITEDFEMDYLTEDVMELTEKLIMFNQGKRYGQIVFMAGGAGSGKGFASKKFMEIDKFKVRDVDEWERPSWQCLLIRDFVIMVQWSIEIKRVRLLRWMLTMRVVQFVRIEMMRLVSGWVILT